MSTNISHKYTILLGCIIGGWAVGAVPASSVSATPTTVGPFFNQSSSGPSATYIPSGTKTICVIGGRATASYGSSVSDAGTTTTNEFSSDPTTLPRSQSGWVSSIPFPSYSGSVTFQTSSYPPHPAPSSSDSYSESPTGTTFVASSSIPRPSQSVAPRPTYLSSGSEAVTTTYHASSEAATTSGNGHWTTLLYVNVPTSVPTIPAWCDDVIDKKQTTSQAISSAASTSADFQQLAVKNSGASMLDVTFAKSAFSVVTGVVGVVAYLL